LVIVTITVIILLFYYFIVKAICGGFSSLITLGICCQAALLDEAIILENSVAKNISSHSHGPMPMTTDQITMLFLGRPKTFTQKKLMNWKNDRTFHFWPSAR
jgi:hypothetical protein